MEKDQYIPVIENLAETALEVILMPD